MKSTDALICQIYFG